MSIQRKYLSAERIALLESLILQLEKKLLEWTMKYM